VKIIFIITAINIIAIDAIPEIWSHHVSLYLSLIMHLSFDVPLALAHPDNLNLNCEYTSKYSRAQAIPKDKSLNLSDIQ
jgi:hypothetical protein